MFAAKLKELRKNKKGFTLVEIIVVLVILAILVGAITPSMLRYINDARGKALVAEARVGIVAAQIVYITEDLDNGEKAQARADFLDDPYDVVQFKELVDEVSGKFGNLKINSRGQVTTISYEKGGRYVTIYGGVVSTGTGEAPAPPSP